ncbi:MAG TPA: hypothetical protein VGI64_14185 [Streptosporangiaceae bacterium]
MQGGISRLTRSRWRAALACLGTLGLVAGAIAGQATAASATPIPPSTSGCNYSNAATPANPANVDGVTPASTITVSCSAGSYPASSLLVLVQTSGLGAIVSPSSANLSETDLGSLALVAAAADGSLNVTFKVPAAFTAPDANATCPPTQAQINVGLACDLVTLSLSNLQPLNEAQLDYSGQGTPNAPTLQTRFTVSRGVKTLTASDVPGACPTPPASDSRCWWGAPVPGTPSAGFGNVPAPEGKVSKLVTSGTLTVSPAVYCQTGATADACAGLPAGTLVPPALSGTVTTSKGLQPFMIDEPNTTPYQGNGTLPALVPGAANVQAQQTGSPIREK